MKSQSRYKIVGYTSPLGLGYGPLVTIVKHRQIFAAIFPDCSFYKLRISSTDDLKNFMPECNDIFISNNQYAYKSLDGTIHIMFENDMLYLIKRDYEVSGNNNLRKLINEEETRIARIIGFEYLLNINKLTKNIRVFFTDRKLSNGIKAKRLHVQNIKNGSVKSSYKKNLRITDFDLSSSCSSEFNRIYIKLRGAINNLSNRYKEDYHGLLIAKVV